MLDPFGGVVHAPEELDAMMAEEASLRAADAARAAHAAAEGAAAAAGAGVADARA